MKLKECPNILATFTKGKDIMRDLKQNISQLDRTTHKKLRLVQLVELVAFFVSVIYFLFYWGYLILGDTNNLGLAGLVSIFILPATLVALAWRFFVWREVRKMTSRTKVLLWIDALAPAVSIIPGLSILFRITSNSIGLSYPLSFISYLRIPYAQFIIPIGGMILGVICLVFGISAIDQLQKIQAGEATLPAVDPATKRKMLRYKILFGLACGLIFALGVWVWGSHYNRQQGFDDPDHDGVLSLEEERFQTSKTNPDTDGDGLDDCTELGFDSYNDQLPLSERGGYSRFGTDPLKADTDGDGINDGAEVAKFSNPVGTGLATQEQLTRWDTWPERPECAARSGRSEEYVKRNKFTLPTNRSGFPLDNRNINASVLANTNVAAVNGSSSITVSDVQIKVQESKATVSWKTDVPSGGIFYYGLNNNTENMVQVQGYSNTSVSLTFPISQGRIYKYVIDPCVLNEQNNPTCYPQPESSFRTE